MATQNLTKQLEKIGDSKDINILLLGETGVGKSTFINAIANYLHFQDFKKAAKVEPIILIPSIITVSDEHSVEKVIKICKPDESGNQEIGEPSTQVVKAYVFPIGKDKLRLRLIDTPGMGDTKGIKQDDLNCKNILAYLSNLKELHAICFLMKPTNTGITVLFEYCVKQILSGLEKSALNNLIFIFTNTRGTNFTGGDTLACLQKMIEQIHKTTPNIKIPLKNNVFCFDNEAFLFLIAIKNNIKIGEKQKNYLIESWNSSAKESWKMISYITGDAIKAPLKAHLIENTACINEARCLILLLCKPLAEVSETINDNIRVMQRHQQSLLKSGQTLNELKKKLYVPVVNLEVIELKQPVTVCAAAKCAEMYQVGSVSKWHYRQRCHDPCSLKNIPKEVIGDRGLMHCAAMKNKLCQKCGCDFAVHMHVYYLTNIVDDKIVDNTVQANINDEYQIIKCAEKTVMQIKQRMSEYEEERTIITKCLAKFAHFLQNNASLTSYNDAYKKYIKYLIEREERLGANADQNQIKDFHQLLSQYEQEKTAFEDALKLSNKSENTSSVSEMTPSDILQCVNVLYSLKHNGKKISELLESQRTSQNSEYNKTCEYILPKITKMNEDIVEIETIWQDNDENSSVQSLPQNHKKDENSNYQSLYTENCGSHNRSPDGKLNEPSNDIDYHPNNKENNYDVKTFEVKDENSNYQPLYSENCGSPNRFPDGKPLNQSSNDIDYQPNGTENSNSVQNFDLENTCADNECNDGFQNTCFDETRNQFKFSLNMDSIYLLIIIMIIWDVFIFYLYSLQEYFVTSN